MLATALKSNKLSLFTNHSLPIVYLLMHCSEGEQKEVDDGEERDGKGNVYDDDDDGDDDLNDDYGDC